MGPPVGVGVGPPAGVVVSGGSERDGEVGASSTTSQDVSMRSEGGTIESEAGRDVGVRERQEGMMTGGERAEGRDFGESI